MAFGSFSTALSGLNANATYLNVIGNNLANINTIGFKASSISFMDLVSQTLGGGGSNPVQVGLGVLTGSISPVFSQGSIDNTREATNMAIQGAGFFVVRGDDGSISYTRAGNFTFDATGTLVTPSGHFVQGYTEIDPLTGTIINTGQPADIIIPPGLLRPPAATTSIQALTNLDAGALAGGTFTTSVQIYDSLGAAHVATITYTNTAPGAWNYDVTVPGEDVTGGTAGTPFSLDTGTITFDSVGELDLVNGAAPADVAITTPTWTNGAAVSNWTWDIVDAAGQGYLTGFASPSTTNSISQNGAAAGIVASVNVIGDGTIVATVSSGQTIPVGQIALATFNNPKGLLKLGSNLYSETQQAGSPNVGVAGTGGRGTIIGSALEQSNVDVALEFTQMILAQRGYQANSKTITVSDELLVDTLNLKR
jgi:flagellar hook protein FlgE